MKKLNDFELLYLVKRGSDDAYNILFQKYSNYLRVKVRNYRLSEEVLEDLLQECLMLLVTAIERFDYNYNTLFFSYVDTLFSRKIARVIDNKRKNEEMIDYLIEKEKRFFNESSLFYNQYDLIKLKEKMVSFYETLSKIDKLVYKEIMYGGMQIVTFSQKYDIKIKSIYNSIQSIRKKFDKFSNEIK